jgi:hypothetical protein
MLYFPNEEWRTIQIWSYGDYHSNTIRLSQHSNRIITKYVFYLQVQPVSLKTLYDR